MPKKVIVGKEFEKAIVEFRIGTHEYSFVSSFLLNKALRRFGTKLAQKRHFRDGILGNNC